MAVASYPPIFYVGARCDNLLNKFWARYSPWKCFSRKNFFVFIERWIFELKKKNGLKFLSFTWAKLLSPKVGSFLKCRALPHITLPTILERGLHVHVVPLHVYWRKSIFLWNWVMCTTEFVIAKYTFCEIFSSLRQIFPELTDFFRFFWTGLMTFL